MSQGTYPPRDISTKPIPALPRQEIGMAPGIANLPVDFINWLTSITRGQNPLSGWGGGADGSAAGSPYDRAQQSRQAGAQPPQAAPAVQPVAPPQVSRPMTSVAQANAGNIPAPPAPRVTPQNGNRGIPQPTFAAQGPTDPALGNGPTRGLIDPGLIPSRTPTVPALQVADQSNPTDESDDDPVTKLLAQIHGQPAPSGQTTGLADAGSILGALGQGEANTRVARGNFTQNYDQLMQQAQSNRNANEDDALKKLAITSYLKSGGSKYQAPSISLNGSQRTTPSFGTAPLPASAAQMEGAGTLEDMLKARLAPGGSAMPTPLDSYTKQGALEKLGNYGGAAVGGLGAINSIMDTLHPGANNQGSGNVLGNIVGGIKKVPWGKVGSGLSKIFGG